jgi:hypothetical protein
LPAFTGRHWPVVLAAWRLSAAVHAEHPLQSLSQHTPSATTFEMHSFACVAGWPFGFCAAQVPVTTLQ